MNIETIESIFNDHEKVLQKSRALFPVILDMAEICRKALSEGHKILICGNGGSAADAMITATIPSLPGRLRDWETKGMCSGGFLPAETAGM